MCTEKKGKNISGAAAKSGKNWVNWEKRAWGEKLYVTAKFPDDASVSLTHSHSSLQTQMMTDLIQLRLVFFYQT